jgi:WD40 repeat protein
LQRFEVPLGLGLPAVAFSPNGRLALSGGDTAILWDLETHDIIHRFEAGSSSNAVAFSPDGHTALVAQGDGIITLWNVETGKLITRLSSHTSGVLCAVFSPDGRRILSGGHGDGVLRLWDVQYGTAMRIIVSPLHTDVFLSDVALSPNGRAVLWGGTTYTDEPEPAILTDIATGQEIYRFDGYSNGVSSATFAPDGRTALIGGWAGEMILWDMDTGERLRTFTGHMASLVVGSNATYTAFSPDGRTALSVAKEEQAVLWDVAADSPTFGQPIRHFADPEGEILIFSPSFSPDGRTALTGTRSGSVLLWDVETGQVIYRLTGYTGWPGAGFSPDGRTALTWFSGQSNLILWDVGTGQEIRRLSQKMAPCLAPCAAAAFSPDGRTAFSNSVAGVVTQWDIATGQTIRHYLDTGWAVYLSPDGRSFFTTPDAVNLVQWRIDTLDELLAWTLTHRYVRELTCSERETYQIEPLCDAAGNYPASTPYLTATPPATPTVTPTADLKRTTATPTATVTPTVAPLTLSVAHVGENRGDVAIGDTQFWTYEGRAGEVLTIRVEADHPANWDTRREGEPTPEGGWFDTRLSVTSPEGAILMHGYSAISIQYNDIEPGKNTNSQVEGLILPVDGTYLILVSGNLLQTGGAYTLTIESEPPGTIAPTLGR